MNQSTTIDCQVSSGKTKIQGDSQKFLDRFKLFLVTNIITIISSLGKTKIQGDGRKFLDHFKSYFGSQIS